MALSTTIIAELSSGTGDPLLKMAVLFRELARRLTTSTLQKLSQGRPDGKRGKIEIPMAKKQANNGETTAKLGFEAKLWAAADALRNNMDAAEYKHVVLGLIFLKYISDAFEAKHAELEGKRKDGADPEDPDEYRAFGIFWVPKEARWTYLKADAPQPTIGKIVDDAMTAIERDNPSLKGVLPKEYARPGLDKQRLGRLINLVSDIALGSPADRVKDTLGASMSISCRNSRAPKEKRADSFTHRRAWCACWWKCPHYTITSAIVKDIDLQALIHTCSLPSSAICMPSSTACSRRRLPPAPERRPCSESICFSAATLRNTTIRRLRSSTPFREPPGNR